MLGILDAHKNIFTSYHDDDDETGTLMPFAFILLSFLQNMNFLAVPQNIQNYSC